jgi:hypothetical protein
LSDSELRSGDCQFREGYVRVAAVELVTKWYRETGSFVDVKTGRRYWADVPTIGDTPVAVDRFWQVLTRARWGIHMFGVVRREILQQTSLLPNFAGSDRAMLAELALLGRFRCADERTFLKRFHANVSWALDHKELKSFLSTDGKRYSRRLRQIKAFFGGQEESRLAS